MNIQGKTALVTGGAVRIGAAITRALAKAGARLVIHCRAPTSEAEAILQEIGGPDARHRILAGDLLDSAFTRGLVDNSAPLDILVNNASQYLPHPLETEDEETARRLFEINFWIPLRLMADFHRQNRAEGVVVNLLDQRVAAHPRLSDGCYGLSKRALADATRSAAAQFAPRTRVAGVAPGACLPPAWLPNSKMPKELAAVPTGRPVTPAQVAMACLFAIENDSVNGDILLVDGGAHLRCQTTP